MARRKSVWPVRQIGPLRRRARARARTTSGPITHSIKAFSHQIAARREVGFMERIGTQTSRAASRPVRIARQSPIAIARPMHGLIERWPH